MLVWLDGDLNVKDKPQENFGRELMELFTFGVEHYVETDVYAAARVFTGWNLRTDRRDGTPQRALRVQLQRRAARHEREGLQLSDLRRTAASASRRGRAAAGMQDGLDLINALAIHPETAKRLARRLWTWFVSEIDAPDEEFVENIADVYLKNDTEHEAGGPGRAALAAVPRRRPRHYQRYSWPVEFVVRAIKEVGLRRLLGGQRAHAAGQHGPAALRAARRQRLGARPGLVLDRRHAGADELRVRARDQPARSRCATRRAVARTTPEAARRFVLEAAVDSRSRRGDVRNALLDYVRAGGTWTGSDTQLLNKTGGLFHLLTGSGELPVGLRRLP